MFLPTVVSRADPDKDTWWTWPIGRAHHRAIHFINRWQRGTTVNTAGDFGCYNQSLNRCLRTLIADGLSKSQWENRQAERHLY